MESVVVVVVDTLRADRLTVYGYERRTSPHLSRWAREGAVFERAHATSPWTLPTFGSLFTGELPVRHGAGSRVDVEGTKRWGRLDPQLMTLGEKMSAVGFATGAFINNPWLKPEFGLARGFMTYDYHSRGREQKADAVVDRALAWIEARERQRFCLVVNLFDPHMTYSAPTPFRGRFTQRFTGYSLPVAKLKRLQRQAPEIPDEERAFIGAAYDEEVAFVDQQLDRFFATLNDRSLWQRLLVIVTSDHGEELFDHDGFEHGHTVFQELLHVPLMIWGPEVRAGRFRTPVSVVDIPATILDSVGAPADLGSAGESLWPILTRGREAAANRLLLAEGTLYGSEQKAAIRWPYKVAWSPDTDESKLFDLQLDPDETIDLTSRRLPEQEGLLLELRARRAGEADRQSESEEAVIDPETLKELRSLGYID